MPHFIKNLFFILDPDFRQDDKYLSVVLKQLGYHVTDDPKTVHLALRAFQMHYRPSDIRGIVDAETLAIMASL